jgi:hypothetical protein
MNRCGGRSQPGGLLSFSDREVIVYTSMVSMFPLVMLPPCAQFSTTSRLDFAADRARQARPDTIAIDPPVSRLGPVDQVQMGPWFAVDRFADRSVDSGSRASIRSSLSLPAPLHICN